MTAGWQPDPDKRRIVSAAVLINHRGGQCIKLIAPRHWDQTMHEQLRTIAVLAIGRNATEQEIDSYVQTHFDHSGEIQGFVDQWGIFFDRRDSLNIARRQNQIKPEGKSGNPDSDELFSEDLY